MYAYMYSVAALYIHVHISLSADCHKVYGTVVDKADHLYRLEGGEYDDAEFEAHPDRYGSIFADQVIIYIKKFFH